MIDAEDDNAEEEEAEAGSHRMYNKLLMPGKPH